MNWDWEKLQEKKQRQSKGGSGGGGRATPPDLGEFMRKFQNFNNFKSPAVKLGIALVILLWLASGFYIVRPDEVGVVQRFGAYARTTQSGPHYHLPIPIESVKTPKVTEVKRVEIGFRSRDAGAGMGLSGFREVPEESLMLTGDENLVNVQFIVQYQIKEAQNYLFNIQQQQKTVKDAAEASMRDVIGSNRIDAVLTAEKFEVQSQTKEILQRILDSYDSGIRVTAVKLQDVHPPKQVSDAFKDVASAREDKSKLINRAMGYRNQILPQARGQVASILNEAEAYKETTIRKAKGDSERFEKLLAEYKQAQDVTRERLYLEAMQAVLEKVHSTYLLSDQAADSVVPYLPLDQLGNRKPKEASQGNGQ
ncbi:FtsH protease activity modulator HflK [Desulfovermiculus halophilus]|jgi:membrane protease subunit HflK|uniref:FtsH protease activity modulator HflK n=1 Tax=Desulfovermiculus halophilus TaxID=339722 RepID=UPI00047F4386|nr:FtsH protease activity modulator HflK [Desulfovermiculus halophilus]